MMKETRPTIKQCNVVYRVLSLRQNCSSREHLSLLTVRVRCQQAVKTAALTEMSEEMLQGVITINTLLDCPPRPGV